ncbi:MAG: hypothetical protein V4819_09905 [Verrucomicrobiota bacterium]
MKSRQIWITAGTALISFALGVAFAPSWKKSAGEPATVTREGKSSGRSFSSTLPKGGEETAARTRVSKREEKKKPAEPRISVPVSSVAKTLKGLQFNSDIMAPFNGIDRAFPFLGATEAEEAEIKTSLKRAKDELLAAEKRLIKVIQTDQTQIRMDNSSMRDVAQSVAQQVQTDIRSNLPGDTAEILISSINWEQFYPTDEKNFPTLSIIRQSSSRISAMEMIGGGGHGGQVHGFADDGTPIPADQVFNDRWKPFLKGLTLLPQNEK